MDPTVLSVIGVGVGLAALILNGQRTIRGEINGLRGEIQGLRSEMNGLRSEMNGLRSELHALAERVARIEGQLAGPPRFLIPTDPRDGEQAA